MADWLKGSAIEGLFGPEVRDALRELTPQHVPKGTVLFRPQEKATGFVVLLSGRIHVYLNSRSGRELLLYSIDPGQTCLQTTLALLGSQAYSGEAIAETDLVAVVIPWAVFTRLMGESETFRTFVFRAFAERVGEMTNLLEMVAFMKVEYRLARWLLDSASEDGLIEASHADIAAAIGTAREVVSRRLEALAERKIIQVERRQIQILNRDALSGIIAHGDP